MKKNLLILLCTIVSGIGMNAQIFCPDDIVVSCLSDLTPDECGMATVVSGNYHPTMVKYVDQNETNACNEGTVYRRFYLDVDYSNTYSENEPSCVQTITLEYSSLPLNIQFPSDKEYNCLDEIPVESPTWSSHPCDLVGYTYEDEVFDFEAGACLKIVRTYTVLNWCVYDEISKEGLYSGVQIIKIVDNTAPEIEDCTDQYFDAGENCETFVTLINSGTDSGDCPSGTLTWRVSVDLWADGTPDMFFGPNEPMPFRLNPIENGETIEIEIPEALGTSKHKVDWKVTDGCGNVRSCSNMFFVEDNKPPTPYCVNFTASTLNGQDGGQLVIPASFFSLDGLDNCSEKEDITLSFSENIEDTERIIACGDAGLQFYRIYYTDEAGNQDFCEVFMFVFDNGSCAMRYAPEGSVSKPNGTPIHGAGAYLMEGDEIVAHMNSDEEGFFTFGDQDLMEAYEATVKSEDDSDDVVDIEDFIMMRSALLGLEQLDFYQKVAADVDKNATFDIDDLYKFKDVLLGKSTMDRGKLWTFIPQMKEVSHTQNDLQVTQSIPYTLYGNGFDFYGIRTGDLTGSAMSAVEEVNSSEEVDLVLEVSKNEIIISAGQDFVSDAFQFDLNVFGSRIDDLTANESLEAIDEGQRYMNINTATTFEQGEVLMKMNTEIYTHSSMEELVKSSKLFKKNELQSSSINWTFVDKRKKLSDSELLLELSVFPLPMVEKLTISGANIKEVSLFTVAGQMIDIDVSIEEDNASVAPKGSLPHGVYFLKVASLDGERIIKVIK